MSTDTYRVDVAAAMYASQLKKICGEGGTGGIVDFPVKKRPPRSGGDWDFAASAERRPLNKDSIYKKGKDAVKVALNRYSPLYKIRP